MKTKIDYRTLTIEALEAIVFEISREIESRKKAEAEDIRKKIENLLKQSGLTIDEVFTEKTAHKTKGVKAPIKYRNPANFEQTWSGRGKMPIWMRDAVDGGATRESFEVK